MGPSNRQSVPKNTLGSKKCRSLQGTYNIGKKMALRNPRRRDGMVPNAPTIMGIDSVCTWKLSWILASKGAYFVILSSSLDFTLPSQGTEKSIRVHFFFSLSTTTTSGRLCGTPRSISLFQNISIFPLSSEQTVLGT